MLNRMRTDAKTCHYLVIIWIYTVKSLQERTFFLIVMYFYFQILSQEDPTLRHIYYYLLTMLDVTWGIFLDEDGWAARSSGGRDGALKSWTAAPSMSSKRRDLRVGGDFKLLVYFVFLFHVYFYRFSLNLHLKTIICFFLTDPAPLSVLFLPHLRNF